MYFVINEPESSFNTVPMVSVEHSIEVAQSVAKSFIRDRGGRSIITSPLEFIESENIEFRTIKYEKDGLRIVGYDQ